MEALKPKDGFPDPPKTLTKNNVFPCISIQELPIDRPGGCYFNATFASLCWQAAQDLADTTQNYDDTEAQMEDDIAFFEEAVKNCEAKAGDWEACCRCCVTAQM